MQLIAVDIGNSAIKLVVDRSRKKDRWSTITRIDNDAPIKFELTEEPAFWAICSVNRKRMQELAGWISTNRPSDQIHQISEAEIKIRSNVESRDQVGKDRLLAAFMAYRLNDKVGPIAVVDAGTAVTVDLVDDHGRFQGGTIFPGAETVLRNLSQATDALPDLSDRTYLDLLEELNQDVVGKSTNAAILSGVYHCQIGGITHIIDCYDQRSEKSIAVYATGGGISDIQMGLPATWNYVPDLVLRGAELIGHKLMTVANEN